MSRGKINQSTRKIADLKRLRNSVNGNPRYRVTFADGTVVDTAADHGFAFSITEGWIGQQVTVQIGGRGTIVDLEPFTSCDGCLAPVAKGNACPRCSS